MISIILPVYNVAKYLSECMDSVLKQTYSDLEVICINDGSTDDSLEILEEYASLDNRVVIINQENKGQGAARNKGIKLAKGEYILFVDPDDWVEADTVESAYQIAKNNNAQIVQFNYQTYNESSGEFQKHNLAKQLFDLYGYNLEIEKSFCFKDVKKNCLHSFDMHIVNRLYLTKFLKDNNIIFSDCRYGEDWLFSIGTLIKADMIFYLDKYNYNYRIRNDSSCNSINSNVMNIFRVFNDIEILLSNNHLNEYIAEDFEAFKLQMVLWALPYMPNNLLKEFNKNIPKYLTNKDCKFVKKIITKQKIKHVKTEFRRKVKELWKNIISL